LKVFESAILEAIMCRLRNVADNVVCVVVNYPVRDSGFVRWSWVSISCAARATFGSPRRTVDIGAVAMVHVVVVCLLHLRLTAFMSVN
jgi:hypothetical protein